MNTKLIASLGLLSSATLLFAYLNERKNNDCLTARINGLRSDNKALIAAVDTMVEMAEGKYESKDDALNAFEFKMITRNM